MNDIDKNGYLFSAEELGFTPGNVTFRKIVNDQTTGDYYILGDYSSEENSTEKILSPTSESILVRLDSEFNLIGSINVNDTLADTGFVEDLLVTEKGVYLSYNELEDNDLPTDFRLAVPAIASFEKDLSPRRVATHYRHKFSEIYSSKLTFDEVGNNVILLVTYNICSGVNSPKLEHSLLAIDPDSLCLKYFKVCGFPEAFINDLTCNGGTLVLVGNTLYLEEERDPIMISYQIEEVSFEGESDKVFEIGGSLLTAELLNGNELACCGYKRVGDNLQVPLTISTNINKYIPDLTVDHTTSDHTGLIFGIFKTTVEAHGWQIFRTLIAVPMQYLETTLICNSSQDRSEAYIDYQINAHKYDFQECSHKNHTVVFEDVNPPKVVIVGLQRITIGDNFHKGWVLPIILRY